MNERFSMPTLVLLTSLALCFSSGCEKTEDATAPTAGPGVVATPAAANWPGDLPQFAGGKLAQAQKNPKTGEFMGAMYTEVKDPQTAFQQYKTALEAQGWVLDEDISTPAAYVGDFTKGETGLHVSVSKDGLMANLLYLPD